MIKSVFLGLLLLICCRSDAQINYAVNLIPADLKARASAVIRNSQMIIDVKDLEKVNIRIKKAITVLNKNGDAEAVVNVLYDRTRHIKSIKATLYDDYGLPIRKIAEKDFNDESAANNFSLFEDFRTKRFSPAINNYPYTLEYEYEIDSEQSLIFPDWDTGSSAGTSIENASLTISTKPDFNIRYKEINYSGQVSVTANQQGYKIYNWEIKNVKALKDEPYSPDPETYLPSIKLAPEKFSYGRIKGSFSNWQEYGKWTYDKLLQGRGTVSPQTAEYIKNLVKDIKDPKLRAKKIYEYVQQKTRYVSVQIGIGGYQPVPALEVDRIGYGDCKGLVNYTKSLLSVIGIESYYTLVEAGNFKRSAITDFASMNQFNHAILCLPFKNDTTWIDCTSKTFPFGFLGEFTADRLVIACTPEGGKIIRTPQYSSPENKQVRKANFVIDQFGNLSADMITSFEGLQYQSRSLLIDAPYVEQIKKLHDIYNFDDFDVESLNLKQNNDAKPVTIETIKFKTRYGSVSGDRIYLPLNTINQTNAIKEVSNRVNPVYINRGFFDVDEIDYTFPEGYRIEALPPDMTINRSFGQYSNKLNISGNKAVYTRSLQIKEGTYSAGQYVDMVDFYQKIVQSDGNKLILIKKQ
jgi:transglutaminase-like putative cysteine protease